MKKTSWSRRDFMKLCTIASGAVLLEDALGLKRLEAAPADSGYLLFCYFSGGWDQLLALDPRDATLPAYQEANAYKAGGSGIYPAYADVLDTTTKALVATNPSGVQTVSGSPLTFGPAVPPELLAHAKDLSLLRGINMGTLTHEVGRRYFITGKFPRGLAASGSALPTAVVSAQGDGSEMPNLAVGVETYNETFPAYASGIQVASATDVSSILKPLAKALPAGSRTALTDFQDAADTCTLHELDGNGLATLLKTSTVKARDIVGSNAAAHFAFTVDPTKQSQEIKTLFNAFGIATSADLSGPLGMAAMAAQAFTNGISRAVSLQLAAGIDDHDDGWAQDHATNLRRGFSALGKLIAYLKGKTDASGKTFWEQTTLLVFSEFARTPLVNTRGGRDHHLASSCLLAGPGLKRNVVVGATSDKAMAIRRLNATTGKPDDAAGIDVRPPDVHATILKSMGLSYDHLSNQSPRILSALLK